ncbi:MAG TPA: hypothetical protein VH062_25945 [Polyangiaceae bacterium]|jgi:hypothetical protein|nr:hypothetical protein [Polyangiaceae bacterium]
MRRRGIALGASALAFTIATGLTGRARADEPALAPPPNPPPPATANANAEAHGTVAVGGTAQGNGAMTLPREERRYDDPPPRARVAPGNSEHDQFIGTLAIGYLGRRDMVVGCNGGAESTQPGGAGCGGGRQTLNAPVIGIRYWITDLIGIDAGLGMAINSLSGNNGNNRPSSTAFILHGGVPLALASAGHFTFEVIPEMNLGFSSWSMDGNGSGSGFHFDIGARAGAEIHFGFIGIPQLSLQGTVGLALAFDSSKGNPAGGGASNSLSEVAFATSVQDNPWNIFTSNVAALYYF